MTALLYLLADFGMKTGEQDHNMRKLLLLLRLKAWVIIMVIVVI